METEIKNAIQDERIKEVFSHIKTMNSEMGRIDNKVSGLEKTCNSLKSNLNTVKIDMAKVVTDVSWLKKNHWIVVTATLSTLAAVLLIFLRK